MKGLRCLWIGIVYIVSMSVLSKLIYIIIIITNENPANFFCCKTGDSKSHMEKPKAKNNKTKLEEKKNVVLLLLSDVKTL